jgi:WD40 repeat protein
VWSSGSAGDVHLVFPDPGRRVDRALFSADGERLVVTSDRRLAVWNLPSGTEALVVDDAEGEGRLPDMGAAISDDGDLIASPVIRIVVPAIMDAETGEQLHLLTGLDGPFDMAFVPGGHHLLVASRNGTLRLWDADEARRPLAETSGAGRFVDRLDVTPDGTRAATVNSEGVLAVWSLPTLELEAELGGATPPDVGSDVAIDPTGTLVAQSTDVGVDLWDAEAGRLVRRLTGHVGAVNAVAFSPDGSMLASAGADGRVVVRSTADWSERLRLAEHSGAVNDVAFSLDGRWLATAGFDGTARVQLVDPSEIVALARARVGQATADAP